MCYLRVGWCFHHLAAILSQSEDLPEDVDGVSARVDEVDESVEGDEGSGSSDAGWAVNNHVCFVWNTKKSSLCVNQESSFI